LLTFRYLSKLTGISKGHKRIEMAAPTFKKGKIKFAILSLNGQIAKTYYRVYSDLTGTDKTLLIALHGGPGACYNYMRPLADMAEKYGIPVILYDQIGNGLSTHFPEKNGDVAFWTVDLFVAELDNLIDYLKIREGGFNILGHSVSANSFFSASPGPPKMVGMSMTDYDS
jgi:L-proline amide hydrolase